jgi:hypothetical protein
VVPACAAEGSIRRRTKCRSLHGGQDGLSACKAGVMENLWEASRGLKPEQLSGERQGAYSSITATLAHVVGAQQVWSARFGGSSPAVLPGEVPMPTLGDAAPPSGRCRTSTVPALPP